MFLYWCKVEVGMSSSRYMPTVQYLPFLEAVMAAEDALGVIGLQIEAVIIYISCWTNLRFLRERNYSNLDSV